MTKYHEIGSRLQSVMAWGIVAVGLLHCFMTPVRYKALSESALWFFSAGLALLYAGAFNLLLLRYGGSAPGLRGVCIGVNLSMLCFVLVYAGRNLGRALHDPGSILLILLVAGLTVFSLFGTYRAPLQGAVGTKRTARSEKGPW